jgi:hypothetical protein
MSNFWRGFVSLAIAGVTLLACVGIARWSHGNLIFNAIVIVVVALCGFHVAAWFSYERKLIWQVLDYSLDLVTVASLIAAFAGIQQSSIAEILSSEFAKRKAEQATLVYSIQSVVTNDCHPKESRSGIWTPSPEPHPGTCERLEHLLPQIEYAFGKETGVDTMTSDDEWGSDLIINEQAAVGSWKSLYGDAHKFIDGSHRTKAVLAAELPLSTGAMKTLAESGKLRFWQYLLAVALGLKIAKKSAGLMGGSGVKRNDKPQPSGSIDSVTEQNADAAVGQEGVTPTR